MDSGFIYTGTQSSCFSYDATPNRMLKRIELRAGFAILFYYLKKFNNLKWL